MNHCISKTVSQTRCHSEVILHPTRAHFQRTSNPAVRQLHQSLWAGQALCPLPVSKRCQAPMPRASPCLKHRKLLQRGGIPSLPFSPCPAGRCRSSSGKALSGAPGPARGLSDLQPPARCAARRPGPARPRPWRPPRPRGQPGSLAATTAAPRPLPGSPPRAGRGQARPQLPGPDSGCHRQSRLSRTAHDAPGSRSPRGSSRPPGTPSSSRAPRLGPVCQDKMAVAEGDTAFPTRPAPR